MKARYRSSPDIWTLNSIIRTVIRITHHTLSRMVRCFCGVRYLLPIGLQPTLRLFPRQVVSFGRLGVLGRNGWYCREADVERWNGLAGWRGLKDPAIRRYFGRFLAFEADGWGPNQELMTNLNLSFEIDYLGAGAAEDLIRARLDAGLPVLFYLWSPHAFNAQYSLNRIQLPAYSPLRFEHGLSDYPLDVLEKAGTKTLSEQLPR